MTVAGQINTIGMPISIPALAIASSQVVGGSQDVTLQMPGVAGLELTVLANSAIFPDGSTTGQLTISQVHLDKVPMPPPRGNIFMGPAWTVQPAGVLFDPPARISIPNNGLPPGRVIDIFQFDHTLNQFNNVGKGTVSEDGFVIVSDPGFGITRSGWGGCGTPPLPTFCGCNCNDHNVCTTDSCSNCACDFPALPNGTPIQGEECKECSAGKPANKPNGGCCGGGASACLNGSCASVGIEAISVDATNPQATIVNYRVTPSDVDVDSVIFEVAGTTQTRSNVSGNFSFSFDQSNLPLGSSTISLTGTKCDGSITKDITVSRVIKSGVAKEVAFGKIFIKEGAFTIPVNHDLFELWHSIGYSVPVVKGSKTVWVGESSVNLKTLINNQIPTGIGVWSEEHYYGDNDGEHLNQMMIDVSGPTLPRQGPNFKSKVSSNNSFFKANNGLTGFATIIDLQIKDSNGLIKWFPIPIISNLTVDKPLD